MAISWYAQTHGRRGLQICADVLAVVGLLACLWLGHTVHDLTAKLAGPGRYLESSGDSMADGMRDAGESVADIPLAGDGLAAPFEGLESASRGLESAGQQQQDVVETLATALGWTMGAVPAVAIMAIWLPCRLRFASRAGTAVRLRNAEAGPELLAFRAMARGSVKSLATIRKEDVDGWRTRDPSAIKRLASLELKRLGLKPYG